MRRVLMSTLGAVVLCSTVASGQTVESGSIRMDLADIEGPAPSLEPALPEGTTNVLANPGFETGSLAPWTSDAWTVTGTDANSGTFSAEVLGNYRVCQAFTAVDVSEVVAITFYSMQPEGVSLQAVDLFYEGEGSDQFLDSGPGTTWTLIDVTADLRGSGALNQICIWGYSGGGPDPDLTRLDDVSVQVIGEPVPAASWLWLLVLAIVLSVAGVAVASARRTGPARIA